MNYLSRKEESFFKLWISDLYDPDRDLLDVTTPSATVPADIKISVNTNRNDLASNFSLVPTPKVNINIDLSSALPETNSGSAVVIASMTDTLRLQSDSSNGINGFSSSRLCANAFSSGELDQNSLALGMATNLKNYWTSSHLPHGDLNCNETDINYLYNSFSCPAGLTLSSNSVSYARYVQKRKCYNGTSNPVYIDRSLSCPQGLIDMGIVRDPGQTTETLSCIFGQSCDLVTETREYPLSLLTIGPTPGTRPIFAGNLTAFIYSYETLEYSATNEPLNGLGGSANLMGLDSVVRYCFLKRDLSTDPNSDYADRPTLSFYKINWQPIIQTPGANDGLIGTNKNGKISVIKGLDTSVRFWLGKDNVAN